MRAWFRFAKTSRQFVARRVGKGAGTASQRGTAWRTPCPPKIVQLVLMPWWARRTGGSHLCQWPCQRPCPPYRSVRDIESSVRDIESSVRDIESKENRPLFAALGQGVALIPLFRLPRK